LNEGPDVGHACRRQPNLARWLPRVCGERPRRHCRATQRDELAPLHFKILALTSDGRLAVKPSPQLSARASMRPDFQRPTIGVYSTAAQEKIVAIE